MAPTSYTITYNTNGGTISGSTPTSYTSETSTFSLPTPTLGGYTFVGWYTSANFSGSSVTQITKGSTGNKTFYAKWVPVEYGITYNLNGGTNASANPSNYNVESETITLANPTRSGYSFAGWYTSSSFSGSSVTQITKGSVGNKTFYAKWVPVEYGITYNLNGGTNASANPSNYNVESGEITLASPTRSGYTFAGWYDNENFTGNAVTAIAAGTIGNKTFYAKWSLITYPITYNLNGGANASINPSSYNVESETITLAAPTRSYYTFAGWYTNSNFSGSSVTQITKGSIGNKTFYAKWVPVEYGITYNLNGGTNASANPSNYNVESETITLANPTRSGYSFAGWYDNENFTGDAVTAIASGTIGNKTFYAKWSLITYSITYNLNGGTDASANPSNYNVESETITLANPTRSVYSFAGWYDNENFTGDAVTAIASGTIGEKTFYAKWVPVEYGITYNLNGGTNASANPSNYNVESETITLANPTRSGYSFAGWYDNENFTGDAVTAIAAGTIGEKTFYAKWKRFIVPTPKASFHMDDRGCYEIATAEDLYGFAAIVNGGENEACGVLTADIEVNKNVLNADGSLNGDGSNFMAWTPIGTYSKSFGGTFDGQNHKIIGLYFDDSNINYVGLFGYVRNSADKRVTISNVGVVDSYLHGQNWVGGLVGFAIYSALTVSNSYSASTVTGSDYVGGLVGYTIYSALTVSNSYNQGHVRATASSGRAGGFAGSVGNSSTITNSYNVGTVEAYRKDDFVYSGNPTIVNSFYIGSSDKGGTKASEEQFKNGIVALALNLFDDGGVNEAIWGQNVGVDDYPNFSGKVENSSATVSTIKFHTFDGNFFEKRYVEGLESSLPLSVEREGFAFKKWYDNATFTGNSMTKVSATTSGDLDFYATWAKTITPTPKASFHRDEKGCYEIGSAEDLYGFSAIVNGGENGACGVLTTDITVNDNVLGEDVNFNVAEFAEWTPIGTYSKSFGGTFDGQNHKIIGLYFDDLNKDYVGLFGYVENSAGKTVSISNVGVVDSYLHGSNYVGGLVGEAYSALTVSSSYSASTVTGSNNVGGLVGEAYSALTVSSSYSASTVTGSNYVGGLVGYAFSALTVSNSYNQGHVRATASSGRAGGFAGSVGSSSTITNSYNVGTVEAYRKDDFVYSGNPTIVNSFYIGSSGKGGTKASEEQFRDGTVAIQLHSWCEKDEDGENCKEGGLNGSAWEQDVDDLFPTIAFDGVGVVKYKIHVELGGGFIEGDEDFVVHTLGSVTTLPIPTRDGYAFAGWYDNENFTGDAVTEIAADENKAKVFYAKWTENISYVLNSADDVDNSANPSTYTEGIGAVLVAPTRDGYAFAGWYDNENFTGDAVTEIAADETGAKTFYAKWSLITYSITYNLNGGTDASANPSNYNVESETITLADPTRSGYSFAGWYDNENFTGDAVTEIAAGTIGNKTFYAKWIQTDFGAITIAADRSSAIIDGNSSAATDLPAPIVVNEVVMKRNFNAMVPSTIVLPFDFAYDEDHADRVNARFYRIGQVYRHESAWKVDMIRTYDLHAGTPYSVIVEDTKLYFDFNGEPVTIKTPKENLIQGSTNITGEKVVGDWSFVGTYTYKAWGEDDYKEPFYGYATKKDAQGNVIRDENGIGKGVFGSIVSGNYILPMRAYLERHVFLENGPKRAPSLFKTSAVNDDVPESLEISFIDGDGQTTAIGHFNTRTGEFKVDRWFDMKGRKLDHKPTTKGIYFNNNKRVIIK